MATPQDPNTPLKDVANGEVERKAGAGMKLGSIWIWIVAAIFIAVLIWFSIRKP